MKVHVENFVRAESDRYFADLSRESGINAFHHRRAPAAVDEQTVVRMNRDTLYSSAVVDISAGATITMPATDGRYQSAMVVNQDHYINRVLDRPGTHRLTVADHDTPYVLVAVRTLVDASDPEDDATANALQDSLGIEAASARPFSHPDYDRPSLDRTRQLLLELGAGLPDIAGAFGSRTETDPVRHLLGTAMGWGGLPVEQARYLGVSPELPVGHYTITLGRVPVRAFWSVTVYNRDGFFEKNDLDRYSVNSITAQRDAGGRVTINLGGDPSLPNQIPIMEGWNYTVRLYQPEPEVLEGSWTFPAPRPAP